MEQLDTNKDNFNLCLVPYTKNYLKMDHRPKCKCCRCKTVGRKYRRKSSKTLGQEKISQQGHLKSPHHKRKKLITWTSSQFVTFALRKIPFRKGGVSHRLPENIYKTYIDEGPVSILQKEVLQPNNNTGEFGEVIEMFNILIGVLVVTRVCVYILKLLEQVYLKWVGFIVGK